MGGANEPTVSAKGNQLSPFVPPSFARQEVCHCYWPAHGMERYGEFAVSSMQETKHDGFVERIFSITDSKVL